MKRFSAKLRQQEQAYRSLHDAARSLLSPKGRVFLFFLLFYKVLTNLLFVPALQLIWALTLRFAPIRLSPAQFASVHGRDENLDVAALADAVAFYRYLLENLR